jgi:hypothetical protein
MATVKPHGTRSSEATAALPPLLGLRRRGVQRRALGGRGFFIGVDLFGVGEEGAAEGVVSVAGDGDDGSVHLGVFSVLSVAAV